MRKSNHPFVKLPYSSEIRLMIENQKLADALTAQIPPALLEYAETLNKLQYNFSSIFTSTAPIFKWANENQALLESFDTIAASLQSKCHSK